MEEEQEEYDAIRFKELLEEIEELKAERTILLAFKEKAKKVLLGQRDELRWLRAKFLRERPK